MRRLLTALFLRLKSFQSGVWRDLTVEERQSVLKIAQLVDEHAETLAGLECLNTGIPYAHLLAGQIRRVALNFRFLQIILVNPKGIFTPRIRTI